MTYRPDAVPKSKKINLVLSGTGALYTAHAGAINALVDLGYSFKALSGTSGGSIIAMALAAGISPNRIKRSLIDFSPWSKLLRKTLWPFNKGWGLYSNKPLIQMLNKLGGKTRFEDCQVPINIVATQVVPNHQRIVFNQQTTPKLTLGEAVRISTSLPILFQAIPFKGKTLTDGTFADNLFIEPFEDDFDNTVAINLKVRSITHPTNFWEYIKLCLSMLFTGQGTGVYTPKNLTLIPIDIHDYTTPLKFRLSRNDRITLYEAGYNAVMKHFNQHDQLRQTEKEK